MPDVRDSRLDPYRDRAAVVRDGDQAILTVYAQHSVLAQQLGGHLWWRRWGEPEEFLELLGVDPSGNLAVDTWVVGDHLTEELDDWSRGVFKLQGVAYAIEWLSDAETDVIRASWQIT